MATYTDKTESSSLPYLNIDPAIEQAIREDRMRGRVSPYRFDDADIKRREDLENDRATLARSAFTRDVEKIINVPAYNRYAGKTQVFSFVENDDITRRGLHVQLVDRVARGIGKLLGLNVDLIEAIALGHDVGHTPFGHAGENFLSKIYHDKTGLYFNHNVHSVRVLDEIYPRNLSLQTLDGIRCHNGEFAQQVLERSDLSTFEELDDLVRRCNEDEQTIGTLRPSTLEGCVVRVSDMIAYIGKDRQDALEMGVIDSLDAFDSDIIGVSNAQIINNITVDIVNNSYGKDRISMSREVFDDLKRAKRQNYEIIYANEGLRQDNSNEVEEMFARMYDHLLDDLLSGDEQTSIYRHHIKQLANKSRTIDPAKYLEQEPNRIVVDYMASMTDKYFTTLYSHLFPDSKPDIVTKDYCSSLKC